jgi:hypothetical protein
MEGMNHLSVLTLDLGITHVLTIVQPFELVTSTLAGLPVSEATWQVMIFIADIVILYKF